MRPLNKWIERVHGPNLSVNHYQPQDCEGSAPLTRLVVSEFPTVEAAPQFYDSAELRDFTLVKLELDQRSLD